MMVRLLMARFRIWRWWAWWQVSDLASRAASLFMSLSEWAMRRARSI